MRSKALMFGLLIAACLAAAVTAGEIVNSSSTDPHLATAVIDRVVNYQGSLKDNSGNPVPDDTRTMTFRVYNAPSGGSALWSSGVLSVATTGGFFSVDLGPIPLPFSQTYYLSIQVAPDAEMAQRLKITMAAYSAVTDTANVALAIPDNSVTSAKIANGTIQFGDIAQNGAAAGQVMKWSGSAWVARNDSIGGGGGSNWTLSGNVLSTNNFWGLAKGNSENVLYGTNIHTHLNLGYACTTGTASQNLSFCTVGGGECNRAGGDISTVSGGWANKAIGHYSAVGGGRENSATGSNALVAGGWLNFSSGESSTIGGGSGNSATGMSSTVAGGAGNTAGARTASVGGGNINSASGYGSVIAGGNENQVTDTNSVVCGGKLNLALSKCSVILGGTQDTLAVGANYSMAFGRGIYGLNSYRFYLFDAFYPGRFALNRDNRDGMASYPIHVGTDATNGNGAYLTAGGTWTNGSSRTFKENFTPYDGAELLSKISGLSLASYNYINSTEKHFGPVAEEFVGAFDTGVIRESDGKRDDMYLSSGDVAGVALAGVQELLKIIEQQNEKIEYLENEIDKLKAK